MKGEALSNSWTNLKLKFQSSQLSNWFLKNLLLSYETFNYFLAT
ncbi:hypothetical protein JavanS136_0002 [Streptococcus satellite phage Javan136]|nr:hypothetical protein JavanS136_0002 [Streptococcus satellite phage Javan136]